MESGQSIGCNIINKNNFKRIFGLVLILEELKVQLIVNYVEFLVDYCGKGMFIIL